MVSECVGVSIQSIQVHSGATATYVLPVVRCESAADMVPKPLLAAALSSTFAGDGVTKVRKGGCSRLWVAVPYRLSRRPVSY